MVKKTIFLALVMALSMSAIAQTWAPGRARSTKPRMALPDTIFVTVDHEMNLWNTALSENPILGAPFFFGFDCDAGRLTTRGFRWRPTSEQSEALDISVSDYSATTVEKASTVVTAAAKNSGGSLGTVNVLFVGDSLMANGVIVAEVDSLFSVDGGGDILPVGGRQTSGVYHEGISGWTFDRFTTDFADNPFWFDGRIDFQSFVSDSLGAAIDIDYMVVQLGTNEAIAADRLLTDSEINSKIVAPASALIDTMASAAYGYPGCSILLSIAPTGSADLNAWGANYGAATNPNYYIQNMRKIARSIIANFDGVKYSSKVDVAYSGLWVDNVNGYPSETDSTSYRVIDNATVGTNFVHPDTDGRMQIADAIYGHLRHFMELDGGDCTNELVNSWDMATPSGWVAYTHATVTGGQPDPWGGTQASKFEATDTSGGFQNSTQVILSGSTVVFSAFFKNGTLGTADKSRVEIYDYTGTTYGNVSIIWTATPTVYSADGGLSVVDSGLVDLGAGWFRVWGYAAITSGHSFGLRINPNVVSPAVGEVVYCAGGQVEIDLTTPCGDYVETP